MSGNYSKCHKFPTFPSWLNHSSIPCFLPFPPPETISERAERPTPTLLTATTITTPAPLNHNLVWAIPPPRTAETAETTVQPPATTPSPTLTHHRAQKKHHHPSIHIQPQSPRSTPAPTTTASQGSPAPSTAENSFEGSGSGQPSGDDQSEEEEESEEEAGSGVPPEASGAEEPFGKSLLFHDHTHNAFTAQHIVSMDQIFNVIP